MRNCLIDRVYAWSGIHGPIIALYFGYDIRNIPIEPYSPKVEDFSVSIIWSNSFLIHLWTGVWNRCVP